MLGLLLLSYLTDIESWHFSRELGPNYIQRFGKHFPTSFLKDIIRSLTGAETRHGKRERTLFRKEGGVGGGTGSRQKAKIFLR